MVGYNILTIKDLDTKLLPSIDKKYHINIILQRMSGLRAFETGLKPQRSKRVVPSDYDERKNTFTLVGKQGKKREVPIPNWLTIDEVIEHYSQNKPRTYNAYYNAVKKGLDMIGHKPWSPKKNQAYTHSFRAYFIIDWIKSFGTTIMDLQQLIGITGHVSVVELQPYLNVMGTEEGIKLYPKLYGDFKRRSG